MYRITKALPEIPMGHRLPNHRFRCRFLHGHNYRVRITVEAESLDSRGMVCDFGELKEFYREILEEKFDHCLMLWECDPLVSMIKNAADVACTLNSSPKEGAAASVVASRLVVVPFVPTVENIAKHWFDLARAYFEDDEKLNVCELEVRETENSCAVVL